MMTNLSTTIALFVLVVATTAYANGCFVTVPEPSSLALLTTGLGGLALWMTRRR